MSPITNSGKATVKLPEILAIGQRVSVRGHGHGTVRGFGCCGHGANRVHVGYSDDTYHHCTAKDIREMDNIEAKDEHIMNADMPVDQGYDDDDDDGEAELAW